MIGCAEEPALWLRDTPAATESLRRHAALSRFKFQSQWHVALHARSMLRVIYPMSSTLA